MEYELVRHITLAEYSERMLSGWRRFGYTLFRPRCPVCSACRSLRVIVARFQPDRSQRRARRANEGRLFLEIDQPSLTLEHLRLYDRYHAYQSATVGWPRHESKDPGEYVHSFVQNPFPTEEWRYRLDGKLVGVGYVDALPIGLSAIYFFHDPSHRDRSLGIWNVLNLIEQAAQRSLPHAYLGYHVADCRSLAYKARFRPYEILSADGSWREAFA